MAERIVIRPYSEADRVAVSFVLEAVARANPGYPFQLAREREALDAWLVEAGDAQRFVATRDEAVIGHAQLSVVSPYIAAFCSDAGADPASFVEVGRVFVDPHLPRTGAGRALVRHLVHVGTESGKQPILLVPEHQEHAVALYASEGWTTMAARGIEVRGERVEVRFMLAPARELNPPSLAL